MADEFVDFYEILELPLNAERSEVRKRISELYIEAQKNLDHRNFNTRVRYQQLFEVTLPQARYILLDAGRRDDYDRLVRVSRSPGAAPPAPSSSSEAGPLGAIKQGAGGFKLEETGIPGESPSIDELPQETPDPEKMAREREELWNKWKSGLQGAMEREAAKEKSKPAETAATPLADRIEAAQSGAPQPHFAVPNPAEAPAATPASPPPASDVAARRAPARAERPKVKFDFGAQNDASQSDEGAPGAEARSETAQSLPPQQMQERRDNQRREVMREELENAGIKGLVVGAGAVLLPGVVAMTIFMSTYYPPHKVSTLPLKSAGMAWVLWLLLLAGLAYLGAHLLSKSWRRKRAMELSMLGYEELMRRTSKEK